MAAESEVVASPRPSIQGLGSWHKEVAPAKGGQVQVLHADGHWYCGKLSQYDESKGRWHIVFDDGDQDWYTLPDRDVRLLRNKARGSWGSFLQNYQIRGPTISREAQRDYFLACQPCESTTFRKAADVFADGGQLYNPNPSVPLQPDNIWPGTASTLPSGSSAVNLDRDHDLYYGARASKKRRGPNQLPEYVDKLPEAEVYIQRVVEGEGILRQRSTRPRRIQLCLFNTYSGQPFPKERDTMGIDELVNTDGHSQDEDAFWTLFVTGRVLANQKTIGEGSNSSVADGDFWELIDQVSFELPMEMYPQNNVVRWTDKCKGADNSECRMRLCRSGSKECGVVVRVRARHKGKQTRFMLVNGDLVKLLGFQSGTAQTLLSAVWGYAGKAGIVEEKDSLHLRLDEPLQQALKCSESQIPMSSVLDRLRPFLAEDPPAASFECRIHLGGGGGSGRSKVTVVEFDVDEPLPAVQKLKLFLEGGGEGTLSSLASRCADLEQDISNRIDNVDELQRKRRFLNSVAHDPQVAVRRCAEAMATDLAVVQTEFSGPHCPLPADEVRRCRIWQEPWAEEGSLNYLWSQGYDVPPPPDGSLLEEDANALAFSSIAAANAAADRLVAAPVTPIEASSIRRATNGSEPAHFCTRCRLQFASEQGLQDHLECSPAHKLTTDSVRSRTWEAIERPSIRAPRPGHALTLQQQQQQQQTLWNQVQAEVKGKGLSVDQTRRIYLERKQKHGGIG